jgi:hypothetical protein
MEEETHNRKWILAVVISFAILLLYEFFFNNPPPAPGADPQTQSERASNS